MSIETIGVGSGVRWGDIAGALNSMLPEIYGMNKGIRPGSRIAMLSSSIGKGSYYGDQSIGVDTSPVEIAGASALTFAIAASSGRFVRATNASVIGSTTTDMLARVDTQIVGHWSKPSACIVWGGYNDAEIGVQASTPVATILSTYMSNIAAIVEKLRVAGIVPILATPLPTANNSAIANVLARMAVCLKYYASTNGIALVDFQTFAVDPATGGLTSAIAAGGDGVHPGVAGQKLLGEYLATQLALILPAYKMPIMSSPLDTTNLIPNGLFAGSPTDGRAPSVSIYGSLPAGATASITTSAGVLGNMQRITCSGTATNASLYQRIAKGSSPYAWEPGDTIAYSGILTTSGITAALQPQQGPPFHNVPLKANVDVTEAHFYMEVTIPSTYDGTEILVVLVAGAGNGYIELGQLTAYNLTKLSLI